MLREIPQGPDLQVHINFDRPEYDKATLDLIERTAKKYGIPVEMMSYKDNTFYVGKTTLEDWYRENVMRKRVN